MRKKILALIILMSLVFLPVCQKQTEKEILAPLAYPINGLSCFISWELRLIIDINYQQFELE